MSFFRNTAVFMGSRAIYSLLVLLIGVLTARWLAVDDRGHYAIFFALVGLVSNAVNLGLAPSNTYFLNRENKPLSVVFSNSAIFVLGVAAALAGVFAAASFFFSFSMGIEENFVWAVLWLGGVSTVVDIVFSGIVLGRQLYWLQSIAAVVNAVLLLLATLAILLFDGMLAWAIGLRVLALAVFALGLVITLWRLVRPLTFAPSLPVLLEQLRYGIKNWFQNLVGLINYRGYLLGVGAFLGPEAAAYFSVAILVVEATRFAPETVGTMLLPKLVSTEGGQQSAAFTARTARNTFFLAIVTVAILLVATPFLIVYVFGGAYAPSIVSAEIMLIGSLGGFFYQILTRYFSSEAKQRYTIYSALASLGVGALMAVALVPVLSLTGVAIAFAGGQLLSGGLMLYFFSRATGIAFFRSIVVDRTDMEFFHGLLRRVMRR